MKALFKLRKKSMGWTDKRAKLLQELLGGIRVIKVFNWGAPFLKRIEEYRKRKVALISGASRPILPIPSHLTTTTTPHQLNSTPTRRHVAC